MNPVAPEIKAKIEELVGSGVAGIGEMKRALQTYISSILFRSRQLPISTDRSYYPTDQDLRNHIYIAKMKLRRSKIDLENLQMKMDEWETQIPEDKFFFRPCTDTPDNDQQHSAESLLFVHQTKWQRHLLQRYGETLCMLDATYKTTKYALPLFFLAVKTNVGFSVVGSFVTEQESTYAIAEALGVLR